jgi:hypothetical protein
VWERDQRDLRESQTYQARRRSGRRGATAPKTKRNGINLADRNDEIRDEFEQRRAEDPDRRIEFVIEDLAEDHGLSTRQIRRIVGGK